MTDVLIIGDGPAGLAAAVTLRQSGKTVTVAGRTKEKTTRQAGECLVSSGLFSLNQLGLSEAFLADGHLPCYGNCSSWGSNTLRYFDFIQSPNGHGWYIDRRKFNDMLLKKAEQSGVAFITSGKAATIGQNETKSWHYYPQASDRNNTEARLVIDASGRSSWLSRQLGINRIYYDKQVALVTFLQTNQSAAIDLHSMVEAVEDGWWYAAHLSSSEMVCIFFTDMDLHDRRQLTDAAAWSEKKDRTRFIRYRVASSRYRMLHQPQIIAAGSSSLPCYYGTGWLAAGDAALAYDPLSSHGVAFALISGIDAGLAACSYLSGYGTALLNYNSKIKLAAGIYHTSRNQLYGQEKRWPSSVYWQRRQLLTPV